MPSPEGTCAQCEWRLLVHWPLLRVGGWVLSMWSDCILILNDVMFVYKASKCTVEVCTLAVTCPFTVVVSKETNFKRSTTAPSKRREILQSGCHASQPGWYFLVCCFFHIKKGAKNLFLMVNRSISIWRSLLKSEIFYSLPNVNSLPLPFLSLPVFFYGNRHQVWPVKDRDCFPFIIVLWSLLASFLYFLSFATRRWSCAGECAWISFM